MNTEDLIIDELKDYFNTEDVTLSDSPHYGLKTFKVDNCLYAVGTYTEAYEAAKKDAKNILEEAYSDEDKVNWLQKNNWIGVDTESVCDAISDDEYTFTDIDEYVSMFGSKASEAISYNFIKYYIDEDEIAQYVIDCDGIAHSLATYDGNEIELDSELYAYRIN